MKKLCLLLLLACLATLRAADRAPDLYENAMSHLNHGVRPNYDKAILAFREAMDAGSANAMCALGELYSAGYGEPRNAQEEPIRLFRHAAALGSSAALHELEKRLRVGIGTSVDLLESCAFYYRHNISNVSPMKDFIRQRQIGDDQNKEIIEKLDKLFEQSLKARNSVALTELAKLHAGGIHGRKNPARACALLTIARSVDARQFLDKLSAEQRAQMEHDLIWMRRRSD